MNTATFIAKRYLFSKKSINAINIISGISLIGVLVASAALIVILSVFNGLENLVLSMYSSFTSELRIEPAEGKVFHADAKMYQIIKTDPRIENYSNILQEKVLLKYGNYQYIANLKGVDEDYAMSKSMDSLLWDGSFFLKDDSLNYAIIGAAIFANLGVSLENIMAEIEVFSPKKGVTNAINPAEEFVVRNISPTGIMRSQQQLDDLIIVPIDFARDVLTTYEGVSAIELTIKPEANISRVQRNLEKELGPKFVIKNRAQQNPELYKLLNTEKWGVFFILAFVLVIAAFNIVGSLTMLVIDKQKDVAVLNSLGATKKLIKQIFFLEGMFISLMGCVIGLALGGAFCLLQQHFGFIHMGSDNLVTDVYPVAIRWTDFLLVFSTVVLVSGVASAISSRLSVKNIEHLKGSE
ncbi:ABC transporter permease [Olivibacter sp. SDN3]|uniref:ABC transporter permease n=1 Tax=Olivibacter sp. SDN3 TaxID=2764720 RepID=UPI001651ACC7|nr:FtsX-like permease family protein [Olivibacter sp. SDN3]QNL51155.1 ABC transporter permease [Olivibacter sp. SDN3]